MTLAGQIALWADRLRDISAMGLRFARNVHDEANYKAIQNMSMDMMALASGQTVAELEPLRGPIFARPTPMTGGDGAVIDEHGQILLIQRADNHRWAMPGGALGVGETPAQGVVREVLEETGVHCRAVSLVGVFDSRLCGMSSRHHLYSIMFVCELVPGFAVQTPSHAVETLTQGWFSANDLPPDLDPGHRTRIPQAFRVWRGDREPFFDRD